MTEQNTDARYPWRAAICQECGMFLKDAGERHPYAACKMFRKTHDGDAVRLAFPGNVRDEVT